MQPAKVLTRIRIRVYLPINMLRRFAQFAHLLGRRPMVTVQISLICAFAIFEPVD